MILKNEEIDKLYKGLKIKTKNIKIVRCDLCGDIVAMNIIGSGGGEACSIECWNKLRRNRSNIKSFKCYGCGKEFEAFSSKEYVPKFCSSNCFYKHRTLPNIKIIEEFYKSNKHEVLVEKKSTMLKAQGLKTRLKNVNFKLNLPIKIYVTKRKEVWLEKYGESV